MLHFFFLPTGILLNKVKKKGLKEYSAYDSMRLCNKQNEEITGLKMNCLFFGTKLNCLFIPKANLLFKPILWEARCLDAHSCIHRQTYKDRATKSGILYYSIAPVFKVIMV